jgi:bis(5'-nucleosyl)-tetraphosphatase (symmetrical)
MATYAIGDVQGCFDELCLLLNQIHFDAAHDCLWFAGDLINRGLQSLEVLRFVKNLPHTITVLGNHDLHLLALASGNPYKNHTLQAVLDAPDCDELVAWLRQQPLIHYDAHLNYAMVHAGLPPQWTFAQAQGYALEVTTLLQGEYWEELMSHMYGDSPGQWQETLEGWSRLRYIVNAFTRLRFCDAQGRLELTYTGKIGGQPQGYLPWFKIPERRTKNLPIVYGHWAALLGETNEPNIYALDTGCVWGNCLTAMRLEDGKRFSVPCGGVVTLNNRSNDL